jgi:hypothetical protein
MASGEGSLGDGLGLTFTFRLHRPARDLVVCLRSGVLLFAACVGDAQRDDGGC